MPGGAGEALASPPMDSRTYSRIIAACTVALLLVVAVVWLVNPLGDDAALPDPLEGVFPLPGDTVVRQTMIEVDLPAGYEVELEVDGISIPDEELGLLEGTGRWSWGPGPGRLWDVWDGGEHSVTARWDRPAGTTPDPGSFTWVFRVA